MVYCECTAIIHVINALAYAKVKLIEADKSEENLIKMIYTENDTYADLLNYWTNY